MTAGFSSAPRITAAISEVIASTEALEAFIPEWLSFLDRVAPPTRFQTPDWLVTWWKHFGSGQLRVVICRDSDRVIGVVPLFLHHWNGRRQLTLVGSGITDCLDPVIHRDHVDAVLSSLRGLLEVWSDWDICDWQDLSADTPLARLGSALHDTPSSELEFAQPFDTWFAARPKDLKRNLRRYREKAEAIAPVSFSVSSQADPELLDALIELHRARWQQSGQPGMIEANGSEAFVRDVSATLARHGRLKFFVVRFGGTIAAILLALTNETTVFSWLSAFDPESEAFGFGRELLAQALKYAHEQGYRRWNFLRGDEPYKFSWGAQAVTKWRVVVSR